MQYAFFGSAQFSVYILDELEKKSLLPSLIITTPDKPVGRGLTLTPTPVKEWGLKHKIMVLDPAKLDADFIKKLAQITSTKNTPQSCDTFIVAAYGKIIPQSVLDIPLHKTLNVHPSLLPRYRGASPLQSAMLDDVKKTGVTIMRIDELMDHGPIIAQKEVIIVEWPTYEVFEKEMAIEGGKLLGDILPQWVKGTLPEKPQDHSAATFTKKILKTDAEIHFSDDEYLNFRKIQAYHHWPTAYFFANKKDQKDAAQTSHIRLKITKAHWNKNAISKEKLVIEKVVPEGKSETDAKYYIPVKN